MKDLVQREFKYSAKGTGILTFRKDDKSADKIIETFRSEYPKLEAFFGIALSKIKIHLLYSRADINKRWGSKTPTWMCGFTKDKKVIYILSPQVSAKVSEHSKDDIYRTLIHETVHLFIRKINKNTIHWLNEGLCLVLAKQTKDNIIRKEDWRFLRNHNFIINASLPWGVLAKMGGYKVSYLLAKLLIEEYNRKIIDLVRVDPRAENFKNKFEEFVDTTLENFLMKFEKRIRFKKEKGPKI